MWEGLATTRRQDRALHGAAKLANLLVGIVALPVWLIGQRLSSPLRRFLERRETPRELPDPAPGERSMGSLMDELEALPNHLHPSPLAELRKGAADLSNFVLTQSYDGANFGYSYPRQFHELTFEGADGVRIAASVAMQETPRPALIVVHGLFTTRRFDYVREPAVRAFFEWGFSVAVVDLRSFGLTGLMNEAPSSGGWKEGEDLIAVAEELRRRGATSVGALGISLGASAVLNAAHPQAAESALDGGIIAVSPPADVALSSERLSREVSIGHPAYPINYGFRAMLQSRVRGSRWPEVHNLSEALDRLSADYYGLDVEEIRRHSSAVNHIAEAKVPTLILHPVDDQIIPVSHARMLAEAAAANDKVAVWELPGGGHGALDAIDRDWTFGVYRRFFERWGRYPGREEGEVVYSPASGKMRVNG
jgi:predicted alpha/beta-fold hydrolase